MKRSLQFKMNTEEGKWKLLDKLYLKIELGKRRKNKNYLIPILTLELIDWAGVKTGLCRPGPGFQVYLTTFQGCYASRAWHIQGLIMKILIQQHIHEITNSATLSYIVPINSLEMPCQTDQNDQNYLGHDGELGYALTTAHIPLHLCIYLHGLPLPLKLRSLWKINVAHLPWPLYPGNTHYFITLPVCKHSTFSLYPAEQSKSNQTLWAKNKWKVKCQKANTREIQKIKVKSQQTSQSNTWKIKINK